MDYTVGTDIICVWAQSDGRGGGHPLYCPVFDMPKIDKSKKKKEKKGEGSI